MSRPSPDELITAWAHRPESLTAEERSEVEALLASDPQRRAAIEDDRALLARIADLPADGIEPVWDDLAASIRAACPTPRPAPPGLWSRWRAWIAAGAGGGLIAAAAATALWAGAGETLAPAIDHVARHRADTSSSVAVAVPALDALDDSSVAAMLDVVEEDPAIAVEGSDDGGDEADDPAAIPSADDLAWIDSLDESSVDTLVTWLDTQPG
jgi:hypothetical protein